VTLSEKVEELEQRCQGLEGLCGEILATLRVNYDRDMILVVNAECFVSLLLAWDRRYAQLRTVEELIDEATCDTN